MSDPFRKTYRTLTAAEQAHIMRIKDKADEMLRLFDDAPVRSVDRPDPRARALATTKLEECVMWAVKAVTG